jgi:hypothetical protein
VSHVQPVVGDPRLYWKPILDANLTYLQLGSFAESGGNGAGLAVQGGGQTVFTLAPMLEAGTQWWLANGTLVRPLMRAGGIWYSNDDLALTASFESAPAGVGPFTINTKLDQMMGLVGVGLDVINGGDAARSSATRRRSTASASKASPSSSYVATAMNATAPVWACGARPA